MPTLSRRLFYVYLAATGFGFTPSYFLLTRFARPSLSLDSLRSPCGPACGCYSAALRWLARKRK